MRVVPEEAGHTQLIILMDGGSERDAIELLQTCRDGAVGAHGR